MATIEQKTAMPQEPILEKREIKDYATIQGFEARALELQKEIAENKELAQKDPEKAAGRQKDIEMHAAGLWLNIRIAQASRVRLGDTPQEVGKNAEQLNEIAEKLGSQPIDAYVYYLEKMLPEFANAFTAIEKAWQDKKITLDEVVEQRMDLSTRISDFIERKVYLVEEMLNSHDIKKMPKEEKDGFATRIQAVREKALSMCRAADAPLEKISEKTEKK